MRSVPLWLKVIYTLWMAVWIPTYWMNNGAENFLWLCDVANFVLLAAIWLESPLLVASQAVSVLVVQLLWAIDYFAALIFAVHPIGGTEYMFDSSDSVWLRALSLFHLTTPPLVLWLIWRLGYAVRGWRLQVAIAWVVLIVTYLTTDPDRNINWLQRPFGKEQTLLPLEGVLLVAMLAIPLVLYLPTHLVLRRFFTSAANTARDTRAERPSPN